MFTEKRSHKRVMVSCRWSHCSGNCLYVTTYMRQVVTRVFFYGFIVHHTPKYHEVVAPTHVR